MKTLIPFQFNFPLISNYASANSSNGINHINQGALIIGGDYYYDDNEAVADHIEYQLAPGTSLTCMIEWLQYNSDTTIADAIEQHLRSLSKSLSV